MAYDQLADFLAELDDDGELMRVSSPVNANLEIAAITERVCKQKNGGPALLFEKVTGHSSPVVTNLLGSTARICKALRADSVADVVGRFTGLVDKELPSDWFNGLKLLPRLSQLTKVPPKTVRTGACQQVVKMGRDIRLTEFPFLQHGSLELRPSIHVAQVHTVDANTGNRAVGLYPLELRDAQSFFIHWNEHDVGWKHWQTYQQAEQQMPIAISLGGDPLASLVARLPLPVGVDSHLLTGFIRGRNVDLVRARSLEMEVPADAEIVLEGMVDPAQGQENGGPVALSTGHYSIPGPATVVQISALTHRANPVLPAMVVGKPPMELHRLNLAVQQLLLPFTRLFIPEVVDFHWPAHGVAKNMVFVSIRKEYPQQARKVMNALWSLSELSFSKFVIVVDDDVDVHDEQQVWFRVGANAHPGRDTMFCEGPTSMSDHAAPLRGVGHKLGIDATRKLPEEGHEREWPEEVTIPTEVQEQINQRWSEYGL